MLILLPITAVIVLFNKNGLNDDSTFEQLATGRALALAGAIGFFIGMYDGFFGPGTGTFMILAYSLFMGFDFKTACGNTKIVNLASNLARSRSSSPPDKSSTPSLSPLPSAPSAATGSAQGSPSKKARNLSNPCSSACW